MKRFFAILIFFGFISSAGAQNKAWEKLLPDHGKIQFAGNIGFLSKGFGYKNAKEKIEGDLYYGYVPGKFAAGEALHSLTGKMTWHPAGKIERKSVRLHPLSVGLLVNYTFGKQFFLFSPEQYPLSFYGYPTAVHFGAFIGGRVTHINNERKIFRELGLYYELGTTDVEMASYLTNRKSLHVSDIFNLGLGITYSL